MVGVPCRIFSCMHRVLVGIAEMIQYAQIPVLIKEQEQVWSVRGCTFPLC